MTLTRIGSPLNSTTQATSAARKARGTHPGKATGSAKAADGFAQSAPTSNSLHGTSAVSAPVVGLKLPPYSVSVKPGDTYWGLAIRFGEYAHVLGAKNHDPKLTHLKPGEPLQIPGWKAYTVHAGDTLSAIAAEHGTDVKTLVKANQLKNPDLLMVGQKLAIPAPGARNGQDLANAVAKELGLGKPVASEGAAGSVYFEFQHGTVRYSNVLGKVESAQVKDPVSGATVTLDPRVLDTAMFGLLGKFKGAEGAAGHTYFQFDRAAVDVSNVDQSIHGVVWPNGKVTPPDQDVY